MVSKIKTRKLFTYKIEIEKALFELKNFFKKSLCENLQLMEVSAPLILKSGTGINDDLNGVEKPVSFIAKSFPGCKLEVVQSLAKWKRLKLADLEIPVDRGIITDMKALRPDEIISPIHSVLVDQWDWEKRITEKDRTIAYLKSVVQNIYCSIKETEKHLATFFPISEVFLPEKIIFIHSEELQYRYPKLTPREREKVVARDHGAVFIIGIGHELSDGIPHDLRAPDYDDWSTLTIDNYRGLNGDIIVWNPVLETAFEISSMGIRVDKSALLYQLEYTNTEYRKNLTFHSKLFADQLPLTVGGGIGQSRLAMLLLKIKHILEVQASFF